MGNKDSFKDEEQAKMDDSYLLFKKSLDGFQTYTPEEMRQKLIEYKKNPTQEEKEEIVNANLKLVIKVAGEYNFKGIGFMDLIQEGAQGLMDAVDAYDPSFGTKFSTLAEPYIRNSIRRYLAESAQTIRIPPYIKAKLRKIKEALASLERKNETAPTFQQIADELDDGTTAKDVEVTLSYDRAVLSLNAPVTGKNGDEDIELGDMQEDTDNDDPAEAAQNNEVLAIVMNAINTELTPREKDVYLKRLGLYGKEMTLTEIGRLYEISPERVRQIEKRANAKVRAAIEGKI